jgi:hypothetical protein
MWTQIVQFQTFNISTARKLIKKGAIKAIKKPFVYSEKANKTVNSSIVRNVQERNRQGVQWSGISKFYETKPNFVVKKEQANGIKNEAWSDQIRKIA